MLCTYAYMDFATRMLLRQAPRASWFTFRRSSVNVRSCCWLLQCTSRFLDSCWHIVQTTCLWSCTFRTQLLSCSWSKQDLAATLLSHHGERRRVVPSSQRLECLHSIIGSSSATGGSKPWKKPSPSATGHIPNSEEESADRKADGPGSIALLQGFCQISKSREILATDTEILAKTLSYVLLSKVRLRATSTRPHDRDSGLSRIPRSCITRGL